MRKQNGFPQWHGREENKKRSISQLCLFGFFSFNYNQDLAFFVARSPPTAEMTVVLVPVACVRTVALDETAVAETSEREVEEATPTGGGGGGAVPSALP